MYTYTVGYDDEEVSIQEGRMVGGAAIGVIQMGPVWVPWVPGNVANATTFNFPVLYKQMEGVATTEMVVSAKPHPQVLQWAIKAGKELEKQGCRAVVGNCGYLANYLPEVAAALDVPCFLSSLMQVPIILRSLKPNQKVGIICANGQALSPAPALKNCGVDDPSRVVIAGAEHTSQMQNVLQEAGHINNVTFEQELVGIAKEVVSKNSDVGAFLLECTEMPPYAWAIQKAVRLPVFDFTTLINWVYTAVVRRPFAGYV